MTENINKPEAKPPPKHPIPPKEFLKMVPSSAAVAPRTTPPPEIASLRRYRISVQYKKDTGGRWNEIDHWFVWTDNTDQLDLLNFGLKEKHRVTVTEIAPND